MVLGWKTSTRVGEKVVRKPTDCYKRGGVLRIAGFFFGTTSLDPLCCEATASRCHKG